jgi:hypothetical protein
VEHGVPLFIVNDGTIDTRKAPIATDNYHEREKENEKRRRRERRNQR